MVLGCSPARAANALKRNARKAMPVPSFRILDAPRRSVRQAKLDPHARREIHRLAVLLRRTELDLAGSLHRGSVQSVAETVHDPVYLHLPRCQKNNVKDNVAFDL